MGQSAPALPLDSDVDPLGKVQTTLVVHPATNFLAQECEARAKAGP